MTLILRLQLCVMRGGNFIGILSKLDPFPCTVVTSTVNLSGVKTAADVFWMRSILVVGKLVWEEVR